MYPGRHAVEHPDRPCFIMADTGEAVSYREYEARSNRLAHLLRAYGLTPRDHYAIFMENSSRYLEMCGAGERSGLFFTPINSHLTADELAYVVDNSESQVLITSAAKADVAIDALRSCPRVRICLVVDATPELLAASDGRVVDYATAVAAQPATPLPDERLGTAMLYSSGTTGRPKGILRNLIDLPPAEPLPFRRLLQEYFRYREGMTYLSPAPLYHSAPQGAVGAAIRLGGTCIIMERFDAEQYLASSSATA
jgi:long-chain acyl-CoA synthetase